MGLVRKDFHDCFKMLPPQGVFRDDGIIRLNSSNSQCFAIMEDGQCTGVAKRNQEANFRVIKVQERGVRMLESLEFPNRYLRIKDGQCDGFVS